MNPVASGSRPAIPPWLLVLGSIASVQVGAAIAKGLFGTVSLVEHVGAESVIAVKLSDGTTAHEEEGAVPGEIMVTVQGYSELKPGDPVTLGADLSEAVLFSRATGRRI